MTRPGPWLAVLALWGSALGASAQAGPVGLRLDTQAGVDWQAPAPQGPALPVPAEAWDLASRLAQCASASPEPAQRWRLADAVHAVVCHHAGVRRSGGLSQQAGAAQRAADARWQPSLNLVSGLDAQRGYGSDTSTVLRLDWVLFDFGQRSAAARQAGQAFAASLDEQRSEVLTAVALAAQLHTTAQAAEGRLEAQSAALRHAQASRQLAEARREAGAASLAERHRADAAVAQAAAEHARAFQQWLVARGALAVAMGLPPQTALSLEGDEPRLDEPDEALDTDALLAEARSRHPQIQAARQRVDESRERLDAVQSSRWGSLGLTLQSGRSRATTDLQMRSITTASLGWTLPLLDRQQQASQRDDALGQWRVREAGLAEAQAAVDAAVWEHSRLWQGERVALRESLRARASAEAALQVTTERYRLGVGSFSDVLAAQAAVASTGLQVADSRAAWQRARWRLAAALGRLGPLGLD